MKYLVTIDKGGGLKDWQELETAGGFTDAAVPVQPVLNFLLGCDRNGNKVLRVSDRERGFSIQTNGNLPDTHHNGVTAATRDEVLAYVRRYGTRRQRTIVGCL